MRKDNKFLRKIKERKKQKKMDSKGITLIALVITIIILIILATVTISSVFGENGLINQALLARDLSANSTVAEAEEMNSLYDELVGLTPIEIEVKISETHTTDSVTINVETDGEAVASYEYYIDGEMVATQSGNTYTTSLTYENKDPYIPSGFRYLEGTVDTGYVIQDSNLKNEFVWIPVRSVYEKAYVVARDKNGREIGRSEEITIEESELSRTVNGSGLEYTNWAEEEGDINDKKSIAYFKHSVAENSGFYMGRYEMGMPGQKSGDAPVLEFTNEARNIPGTPVCVGQVMPWTNIDWSTAKANLESMYNGEVQSAMMNSYARTTTINWILETGTKTIDELRNQPTAFGIYRFGDGIDETVTYKGNYYRDDGQYGRFDNYDMAIRIFDAGLFCAMLDTGADTNPAKRNALNNIYDLAGNAEEWSTEKYLMGTGYRLSGGSFLNPLSYAAVDNNATMMHYGTTGSISTSSRPILYK